RHPANMSTDPPPPYPGGPSAPLIDAKNIQPGGMYPPPPGHFPHPMAGQMGPGPSPFVQMGGHAAATTVTVLQGEMFQTSPVHTVCPHCQQAIVTRISHDVGLMNTLFCLFCFFVGCDLGCCLIPCLIDDLKDVTHTCPNCKGYIYTYKRIC
uniref:Cell death-inducing p53-target protein 1 n=1 Tax=Takifugu rubripes TaxID=31033 RepID=A0A674N0H7_TAKRU